MRKTFLIWLAGGLLFVTLAFFIPEQRGSMWPSLVLSGSAAILYLILFAWFWLGKIKSSTKRQVVGWTLAVLLVFSIASAWTSYEGSKRQTALLPEIRTTIDSGIAESYIKKHLLVTMRAHFMEDKIGANSSLGEIFQAKFDSLITKDRLLLYEGKDTYSEDDKTRMKIFVHTVKNDSIILVAESGYEDGRKSEYVNYSGATGMYQTKGLLTKEGMHYERTN